MLIQWNPRKPRPARRVCRSLCADRGASAAVALGHGPKVRIHITSLPHVVRAGCCSAAWLFVVCMTAVIGADAEKKKQHGPLMMGSMAVAALLCIESLGCQFYSLVTDECNEVLQAKLFLWSKTFLVKLPAVQPPLAPLHTGSCPDRHVPPLGHCGTPGIHGGELCEADC